MLLSLELGLPNYFFHVHLSLDVLGVSSVFSKLFKHCVVLEFGPVNCFHFDSSRRLTANERKETTFAL